MADYLAGVLAHRRDNPKDDLLTRLQLAEVDAQRLTPGEILGFFQLLLLAGSETTTNLLTNAILTFLDHPDQLQRLRADLNLLPGAIEEVLRYRSPLQWMYRKTTRDVTLHDLPIPAGRLVLAVIGSANHDPAVFPHPDRFDITRHPNPHLAFGHGPHFCLGAPLARLEARTALTEFLTRTSHFERPTTDPWPPRPGLHVLGPSSLPLHLTPA
jgi:cytochrome P450